MSDFANDVRRHEPGSTGHPFRKMVDGILRHNTRRLIADEARPTFEIEVFDAIVIVNTGTNGQNATVNLPLLSRVKPGQMFIIQNCDPTGIAGTTLTIHPAGTDPINEDPAPADIVITNPNESRKIQRVLSNAIDSWYTVCCTGTEQEPL